MSRYNALFETFKPQGQLLILVTSATKGDPFVYDAKSLAVNVLDLKLSTSLMKVPTYGICTKEAKKRAQGGSYPGPIPSGHCTILLDSLSQTIRNLESPYLN